MSLFRLEETRHQIQISFINCHPPQTSFYMWSTLSQVPNIFLQVTLSKVPNTTLLCKPPHHRYLIQHFYTGLFIIISNG